MKTHTNNFNNKIKEFGRQLNSKITYELEGETIELGIEQLNSVSPHYEGGLLKSVMKQLDIDSNVEIPLGTILKYQFGVKISNSYEYLDFGNYIVYSSEKKEDTNSYKIVCYDKMLYAMKNYESLEITYPITIKNYINAICNKIGLTFKNSNDTFVNYNRQIQNELYLDSNENTLGYTYRDVLDELAEVTASTICINENDDKLEIRYINDTEDTINEEYLKDINVNFGEKYGPINSIVLSRAAESDNVYLQDEESIEENGLCELKIVDNQIMNFNDRSDYLPDILNELDGLEYYINDFSSTGVTYYDICDKYNIQIENNIYQCIMLNDEINITQGLEENIHTDMPEETETDYQYASKDDRQRTMAYIIAKKNEGEIEALASKVVDLSNTINGIGSITLENAYEGTLHRLEISGSILLIYPSNTLYPSETLTILDTDLLVDTNKYHLDIDRLNYTSATEHDTYIYEDGKNWIERANGTIEQKEDFTIEVTENSAISLEQFPNAIFKCIYLLQNDYTNTFTNSLDIVSKINLSPEKIEINSNKISLAGKTIDLTSELININSKYFKVDSEGNLTATSAKLNGRLENYSPDGKRAISINKTIMTFYDHQGTEAQVGGLRSIRGNQTGLTGISLFTIQGSKLTLGYQEQEDNSTIYPLIEYNTNDLTKTPWIKNTANGTIFSNSNNGITVENGLIKNWSLDTSSGTITINEPNGHQVKIIVKSGLISDWQYT